MLNSQSLFSRGCALFHFAYPVSPVVATRLSRAEPRDTKTAGCVPTIPILVHAERSARSELAARQSSLENDSSSFLSNSCALFSTTQRINPFRFKRFNILCTTHTGV